MTSFSALNVVVIKTLTLINTSYDTIVINFRMNISITVVEVIKITTSINVDSITLLDAVIEAIMW